MDLPSKFMIDLDAIGINLVTSSRGPTTMSTPQHPTIAPTINIIDFCDLFPLSKPSL